MTQYESTLEWFDRTYDVSKLKQGDHLYTCRQALRIAAALEEALPELVKLDEAGKYFPHMNEIKKVRYCRLVYKEPSNLPLYNRTCLEVPYWGSGKWGQGQDAAQKILAFIEVAGHTRPALSKLIKAVESNYSEIPNSSNTGAGDE